MKRIVGPVEDSTLTVLLEIHKRAPAAKILLMGYPKLLENYGQCVPGIGTEEAPWLNATADLLAQHMGEAVDRARDEGVEVWFSNPIPHFAGKAICGDPETINGIVMDKTDGDEDNPLPSAQSFHPKNSGTTLYAQSMNETIGSMGL